MRTTPPTIRPIKHGSPADACLWVDHVRWQPQTLYNSTQLQEGLDTDLNVYTIGTVWNMCDWPLYHIYYGDSSTRSGSISANQKSQMEVRLDGPGTVTFYWKVSSEANYDWLEVYLDGVRQDRISGEVGWQQKSYNVSGAGTHSLMWQYIKDGSGDDGSDRGWVDYLQWTPGAGGASTGWDQITYTYDPAGRRIAKDVDGVVTKYLYDGDQCIAEYDGDDVLLRKFIHGPSIDEPRSTSLRAGSFCMLESPPLGGIEAAGSYAGTYYYHYDALGSVVALSDADGETVQVYEYDVYGQPGAADPGHPNPFAFTGRRFDTETGLYYYRARYYNPTIGRFLQTDPIGYGDGMNLYRYCRNNPVMLVDPSGKCPWVLWCDFNRTIDDACVWANADKAGLAQWSNYAMDDIKVGTLRVQGTWVPVYYVVKGTEYGKGPNPTNGCFGGTSSVGIPIPEDLAPIELTPEMFPNINDCSQVCDEVFRYFPQAMRSCYLCCELRAGSKNPKTPVQDGIECAIASLPKVFSRPGLGPSPKPSSLSCTRAAMLGMLLRSSAG